VDQPDSTTLAHDAAERGAYLQVDMCGDDVANVPSRRWYYTYISVLPVDQGATSSVARNVKVPPNHGRSLP
jgi:hypothetical protein